MAKGRIEILNYKTNDIRGALCIMFSKGATLGNPYYKTAYQTPKGRKQSIERFRQYLWAELHKQGNVRKEMIRLTMDYLKGKTIKLYCCCAPLPCHGEVIAKAISWLAHEIETKAERRKS